MGEAGIADMEERSGESEMIGAARSSMPVVLFFFCFSSTKLCVLLFFQNHQASGESEMTGGVLSSIPAVLFYFFSYIGCQLRDISLVQHRTLHV
jgi:hypothetical protein